MLCNLCGEKDFETVYLRKNILVITSKENFTIDVNNVICKNCGLIFQNPFMDKEKLMNFYTYQYRINVTPEHGGMVREEQLNFVKKHFGNKKGKILDIGSFDGYFLNLFKKDGWETTGVEPSRKMARACREKYGIKVYEGMFENVDFKGDKFDLITIIHTLEHVDDPMNTLKLIRKHLKDEGIVFLEVPNIANFKWQNIADNYDFQHIYNFCVNTITGYMNKSGFEILCIKDDMPYGAIRILARKGNFGEIIKDYKNAKNIILTYKRKREANLKYMRDLLNTNNTNWQKNNKRVFIYGAGFHTVQLFDYVIKKDFHIKGFIDSSPEKEGKKLLGHQIYSLKKIEELKPDVIIISSYAFQDEIYDSIKHLEAEGVEIVRLYTETFAYDTLKHGGKFPLR